ncbi:hypothetical protein H0H87_010778 [Tephrocybe sp. NHM501043]|nr:hypothetical protein H0H87_010778 [Tephrocybe sp. NHM501043]
MTAVHATAQAGFGQGTNELYDRLISIIRIGAGTGIFTRALLAHPEWSADVKQIKAVEPSAGMREVFEKTVKDERATIQDGTFDNTGAFHWCPDYDAASAEFNRILKPGGSLVLIWNLEDRCVTRQEHVRNLTIGARDRARWVAQLRDRIEKHEQGTPQFRLNLWRRAFETASYQEFFQPPVEKIWPYALPTTVDIAVDRALSKSYIAVLPSVEKALVQGDVRGIAEKGEDKVWIDEANGVFEYPYQVFVVVAHKK